MTENGNKVKKYRDGQIEKGRIKKDPEEKEITTKLSKKTTNKQTHKKRPQNTKTPQKHHTHTQKKTPPTITIQMHDNINNTPSVCLQILTWDEC